MYVHVPLFNFAHSLFSELNIYTIILYGEIQSFNTRNAILFYLGKLCPWAVYDEAINKKEHPYDMLKKKGYIKNPFEEFRKADEIGGLAK